jgi:hypothetical protein
MSLELNYNKKMNVINVEEWATGCLDSRTGNACC